MNRAVTTTSSPVYPAELVSATIDCKIMPRILRPVTALLARMLLQLILLHRVLWIDLRFNRLFQTGAVQASANFPGKLALEIEIFTSHVAHCNAFSDRRGQFMWFRSCIVWLKLGVQASVRRRRRFESLRFGLVALTEITKAGLLLPPAASIHEVL